MHRVWLIEEFEHTVMTKGSEVFYQLPLSDLTHV